jgi:hypothetical protein
VGLCLGAYDHIMVSKLNIMCMYLGHFFDFLLESELFEVGGGPQNDPLGSERVFAWGLRTIF